MHSRRLASIAICRRSLFVPSPRDVENESAVASSRVDSTVPGNPKREPALARSQASSRPAAGLAPRHAAHCGPVPTSIALLAARDTARVTMRGGSSRRALVAAATRARGPAPRPGSTAAAPAASTASARSWLLREARRRASSSSSSSSADRDGGGRRSRRPCYGGDETLQLGLPFELTAEDARRALQRWAGCVVASLREPPTRDIRVPISRRTLPVPSSPLPPPPKPTPPPPRADKNRSARTACATARAPSPR
jgi:hypothetical protein